tara:strand:- start:56 stop:379 length:324 start_codon:yes stop_codon:yes gene_type:complete
MALTGDQQKQFDRLSPERQAGLTLSKLERFTPDELRAKVNILGVQGETINWAPENDYTASQMGFVEAACPRSKWTLRIPEIVAEGNALEAEGVSPTVINAILKGRRG